jgi:Xaa-Pro aminopeptidase
MVQINIDARCGGYSSAIVRLVVFGKMNKQMKNDVKFGLDVHLKTCGWIKEGAIAGEVAKKFIELYKSTGHGENYLHGPCHGTGIIEVEKPWMEIISNYQLKADMTFMADTFLSDK